MPGKVDLLIVGAGPAGIAAAVQARRDGLDFLLVGDEPVGGLVRAARRLDNLPGWIRGLPGAEFADRLAVQLKMLGIVCVNDRICSLEMNDVYFNFSATSRSGRARAVIVATGTRPADVDIELPGGPEAGIHRDVRSMPENLRGKVVVVYGGGEAALDSAMNCLDRGAEVVAIARGTAFKSVRRLVGEAMISGIDFRMNSEIVAVRKAADRLEIEMTNGSTIISDHLVLCVGRVPCRELLSGIKLSPISADDLESGVPGLFMAGDLIRKNDRFVATAIGDGQRTARKAMEYLKGRNTDLFSRNPQMVPETNLTEATSDRT